MGHRAERIGEQFFGPMLRAVGGDQRHRITDTVDEPGQALALNRQLCGTNDGGLPVACAGKVRCADREAYRVAVVAWEIQHATTVWRTGAEQIRLRTRPAAAPLGDFD
jgi:hypothetical protein